MSSAALRRSGVVIVNLRVYGVGPSSFSLSVFYGARCGRVAKYTNLRAVCEVFHVPDESIEVSAHAGKKAIREHNESLHAQAFVDVK
jgi:hypothetical protein